MFKKGNKIGHRFKKGEVSNAKGRPPENRIFLKALHEVEKEKKKTLYKHAIEKAYTSDLILKCLLDKMLPDLKQLSGDKDNTPIFKMIYVK